MSKVIDRNTTIPVRRSQIFSTAEDNQPAVDINVLQGERELAKDNRSLGKFKLDGIPPAPRGTSQIEVTFDIDANGILKVSAKEQATNKEQTVTISGSTKLDKSEISQMIKDADTHAAEDKIRHQEVEVRNSADSTVYQVQRQLNESGNKLAAHEKARIEQLLTETKEALNQNASIDKIRSLSSDLNQAAGAFDTAHKEDSKPDSGKPASEPDNSDDVIDAEFTEK
jgi:molecular chaperone DnaK